MLSKRIIPCLDVTDGRVVKGTQFVDLKDAGDAIELAKKYDKEGADELVFLDITASSDKRAILKNLVEKTSIVNEVSGFRSKAIAFLFTFTASKALIALPENGSKYTPFFGV